MTFTHGASAYANSLCRCDICREANTRRNMTARAERLAARVVVDGRLTAVGATHGLLSSYVNWGCRCATCSKVYGDYQSAYYRRTKAAAS